MEQISYKVNLTLLKEKLHARELARKLNINHMTVSRILKGMVDKNVLDYEISGKNKVYFVKKTLDAKNYLQIAELLKANEIIQKYPILRKIFEEIQKNRKIQLAVLFGSYAKGIAKEDSDIDIYIETDKQTIKKETEKLHSSVNVKIGKYDKSSPLIKEIEKDHVIIRGVERYYEIQGFFN